MNSLIWRFQGYLRPGELQRKISDASRWVLNIQLKELEERAYDNEDIRCYPSESCIFSYRFWRDLNSNYFCVEAIRLMKMKGG